MLGRRESIGEAEGGGDVAGATDVVVAGQWGPLWWWQGGGSRLVGWRLRGVGGGKGGRCRAVEALPF